jgi:signal transduction histidine kinase
MEFSEQLNELKYQHEILRAKLEIRDHYLKTIVREIYENTGQLLSLVRVQLAIIGNKVREGEKVDVTNSGELVGQAICDLRNMSRNFYPENEILSELGLINALKQEIKADVNDFQANKIKVQGTPSALMPGAGLIFFQIILGITTLIIDLHGKDSLLLEIIYSTNKLSIIINYAGYPIDFKGKLEINNDFLIIPPLSLEEKLKFIGGEIIIKSNATHPTEIIISMPLNCK